MQFIQTPLDGLWVVETEPRMDERGFFARLFCRREFEAHGLNPEVVQCNLSFSSQRATLRGLHYQLEPEGEDKLVRCVAGRVFDVAVDMRPGSKSYLRWYGLELGSDDQKMLYIPKGFAHGFITLTPNVMLQYQVSSFFAPQAERGLRFDDPAIGIIWPIEPKVVSDKDKSHPLL